MKRYSILFVLFAVATVRALAAVDCGTANDKETTWPVPLHKYANNASIVCKVMIGDDVVEDADIGLFAKADDECRGGVLSNDKGYAWLMAYGDSNAEEMYFKVKVGANVYSVEQVYTYDIDSRTGSVADPVILQLGDVQNCLQIAPAVFRNDASAKDVDVYFSNPLGKYSQLSFCLTLPDGISVTAASLIDRTLGKGFTAASTKNDDGSYAVSLQSADGTTVDGTQGNVLRLTLSADATAVAGLDSFKISNAVLTSSNGLTTSVDGYKASFFYGSDSDMPSPTVTLLGNFALGDAQKDFSDVMASRDDISVIDLTDALNLNTSESVTTGNGNTLVYIAKGMMIGNENNVVKNDSCSDFVIYDDQKLSIIKAFHADKVAYTRKDLNAGGMYTLALPFSGNIPDGCSLYTYDYIDQKANKVHFEETDTILADTPYIIRSAGSSFTVTAEDVDFGITSSSVSDDDFICTYTGVEAGNLTDCYALRNDGSGFGICDATAYVTPFHGYINILQHTSEAKAKFYRLCIGEETGICNVRETVGNEDRIYNLNGQRISTVQRGINIVNGKKILKY